MVAFAMLVGGCAVADKPAADSTVPSTSVNQAGRFTVLQSVELVPDAPLANLTLTGGQVFLRSQSNFVYRLSATLDLRQRERVAEPDERGFDPIAYGDEVIYPSTLALRVRNERGELVRTVALPHPVTGELRLDARGLLLAGVASPSGGRINVIDPRRAIRPVIQQALVGTVQSRPASYQGIVFVANDRGQVFAIGDENRAIWSLPRGAFATGGAVVADLVADDFGVYVASTDSSLYVLNRNTGRIRWRHAAEVSLTEDPLVTEDRVYLIVPGVGLRAFDKFEPADQMLRSPLWSTDGIRQIVAMGERSIFAVTDDSRLVAIDPASGRVRYQSEPTGLELFAFNPDGITIYGASKAGRVVTFRPSE
jgi:hypothetical protein